MKKLFKLLTATIILTTTSLTMVSCFPKEVAIYENAENYKIMSNEETEKQVPLIIDRIKSFENPWMRGNITNDLYFNIKTDEEISMGADTPLNERQLEIMIETLSANLRIYKIIDTDSKFNPKLFTGFWTEVNSNNKKFKIDIEYNGEKFVTMKGEFFVEDTEEISEINENTFVQISNMAAENQKIVTSPGMGAFWGTEFIGDKYSKEEQEALWNVGGKYEYYEWQPKQTMTWKGQQKISIDGLKQTMTDYLTSRLITSGTIQSNLIINYDDVEISTSGFSAWSEQFVPKKNAPNNIPPYYNKINMHNENNDDYYFYFEEDNDFGAKTMIDPSWPYIWYKTNDAHKIKQGGSIFQSHLEYKW